MGAPLLLSSVSVHKIELFKHGMQATHEHTVRYVQEGTTGGILNGIGVWGSVLITRDDPKLNGDQNLAECALRVTKNSGPCTNYEQDTATMIQEHTPSALEPTID